MRHSLLRRCLRGILPSYVLVMGCQHASFSPAIPVEPPADAATGNSGSMSLAADRGASSRTDNSVLQVSAIVAAEPSTCESPAAEVPESPHEFWMGSPLPPGASQPPKLLLRAVLRLRVCSRSQ